MTAVRMLAYDSGAHADRRVVYVLFIVVTDSSLSNILFR